MTTSDTFLGIDLGGTNLRGGLVTGNAVSGSKSEHINANLSSEKMLDHFFRFTDQLMNDQVKAIGIGVPGLVQHGVVYDVVFIPSWKEVRLKEMMESRYNVPVFISNDANCFALGEYYFGKGIGHESMIGLTIGTGLGCGLILNGRLYAGSHGGAGEIGMVAYLDQCYEYYCSGRFFQNVYHSSGEAVFSWARAGDPKALKMYEEMGKHLGNAIKTILFAYDVSLISLGGSVRHAWEFFSASMWDCIRSFPYKQAAENLKIEVSDLQNSAILGAAALCIEGVKV
jgi:glucokinase